MPVTAPAPAPICRAASARRWACGPRTSGRRRASPWHPGRRSCSTRTGWWRGAAPPSMTGWTGWPRRSPRGVRPRYRRSSTAASASWGTGTGAPTTPRWAPAACAPRVAGVPAPRSAPPPVGWDRRGEPVQLSRVRQMVGRWARGAGLDPDAVEDLQLALGEAAGNAVEHAYRDASSPGRVIIELGMDQTGDVAVSVTDAGTWRPGPSDPGSRGRGLQVISALARDVDLDIGPGGTTVRFLLPPAAAAAEAPRRRAAARESPGGRPGWLPPRHTAAAASSSPATWTSPVPPPSGSPSWPSWPPAGPSP